MPFTFAHPAIIIPFITKSGKQLSATGLIVGSMSPDFEYFLRMRVKSELSHTLPGILLFDLPLSIIVCFTFHGLIKKPMMDYCPYPLKKKFNQYSHTNWWSYFRQHYLIVVISILAGVVSHVLWDAFTHDNGYFVVRFTSLQQSFNVSGFNIKIWKLLQHTSTLTGLYFIILIIHRLPSVYLEKQTGKMNYWWYTTIIAFLILTLRMLAGHDPLQTGNIIVSFIAAYYYALVIISMSYSIKSKSS